MKDYSQRHTIKKYTRYRTPSTFRLLRTYDNIKNKISKRLSKGGKKYEP